jgi:hypothetical protein
VAKTWQPADQELRAEFGVGRLAPKGLLSVIGTAKMLPRSSAKAFPLLFSILVFKPICFFVVLGMLVCFSL